MHIHGGVAQLGERTVRIRKVESSILFVSTKKDTTFVVSFFTFLPLVALPAGVNSTCRKSHVTQNPAQPPEEGIHTVTMLQKKRHVLTVTLF